MLTTRKTPTAVTENGLSRRQVLGAVGAAAGALTLASHVNGTPDTAKAGHRKPSVRVAAVSYAPPFHDHRKADVNLQALREMTARVAKECPDFICYPEGCPFTHVQTEKE